MNEQLKQHILGKRHHFAVKIPNELLAKANAESRTIPMSFAAPAYVERYYGILVLNFAETAIMMDRWKQGAPYCMDHNTYDQRGIILNGRMENSTLMGDVKFSQNPGGQELFNDVKDQIRPYTSVGFDIHQVREMMPEEMPDDLKNMCIENQCTAYMCDKWEPLEGSSVAIPANPNVGVQYDYYDGEKAEEIAVLAEKFGLEKFKSEQNSKSTIIIKKEDTMSEKPKKTAEELSQEKKERKEALLKWGKGYDSRVAGGMAVIEQLADDVVDAFYETEPDTLDAKFRGQVFMMVQDKNHPLETPKSFVGMTDKNKEEYSIMKVIRHVIGEPLKGEELGIEKEVMQQIRTNGGQSPRGGFPIPFDMFTKRIDFNAELVYLLHKNGIHFRERFDQTASTTAGGYLVGTQHRPQDFIELFLNALVPGFTYLPGLQQNVDIPKMTGGATITVATSEAAGFSETALTFGQLTLSPKEIGTYIDITRKLLVQSTPAIDNLVATMLMRAVGLKANYLALFGSGGSGEPTGAFATSNIGTFDAAGIGRHGVLDAMADIKGANVVGALQWLVNAAGAALLMERDQTSGYGKYLMDDNGTMITFPSFITEQMASGYLALGKWDEVVLAGFGTLEILYDRSTASTSGGLRIGIYDLIDAGLKHPGAISVATNLS